MPRQTSTPLRHPALGALLLAALLTALPAAAQDTYVFGDDDQWQAAVPPDPASPEGRVATIKRLVADGDYRRAENLASQWIKRNDRHELAPEAYIARGDAKWGLGNEYEALFDYELVARRYPGTEAFLTALRRELEIAQLYAEGKKRKVFGLRIADANDDAEELLIRIQERLPTSALAEEAGMALAEFYVRNSDMRLAAEAFALFIENYPTSPRIAKARRGLIYAHMASFKGPEFDAAGLYEARALLYRLKLQEPVTSQQIGAEALLRRIDESDARKLLENATWYVQTGDPVSAEFTIRRMLRKYPRTTAARDGLRLVTTLLPDLPPAVLRDAPDYDAYRSALIGEGSAVPVSPSDDTPDDAESDQ